MELEPLGPFIGGDLVIEGITLSSCGPAMCTIEYAADHDEEYAGVGVIAPWQMSYIPSNSADEDGGSSFHIPVSLSSDFRDGSVRIRIYVTNVDKIPYDEANEEFELETGLYMCAIEIIKSVTSSENEVKPNEELESFEELNIDNSKVRLPINEALNATNVTEFQNEPAPESMDMEEDVIVVKQLHIMLDMDELDGLYAQGHELHMLEVQSKSITDDFILPNMKFYITAEMGLASGGGLVDVKWIKTTKASGNLPVMDGYHVLLEDLSNIDDDVSILVSCLLLIYCSQCCKNLVFCVSGSEDRRQGFIF